MVASVKQK